MFARKLWIESGRNRLPQNGARTKTGSEVSSKVDRCFYYAEAFAGRGFEVAQAQLLGSLDDLTRDIRGAMDAGGAATAI